MKFLFVAISLLLVVLFDSVSAFNWDPYNPTYALFGDFWDNNNPRYNRSFRRGLTCQQYFGDDDAISVISACRAHSDGPWVRSGCYYMTDQGPGKPKQPHYGILETPCPAGMWHCNNVDSNSAWGTDPRKRRMHAECS